MPAVGIAVICQLSLTGSAGAATATAATATAARDSHPAGVAPNQVNELDCNGRSKEYRTVRAMAGTDCRDAIRFVDGKARPFADNGWSVGHDEPTVEFLSSTPGSGNTMTYDAKLPVDPKAVPTATGSVTDYGQLSPAVWFGLSVCDPNSYPQNPCLPDSDTNIGHNVATAAGSAAMELQLYPPGYTPFPDAPSCSVAKWCAALTIDSLECNFGTAFCNRNCIEPVNGAFIQTNGVPTGPPSPQLAGVASMLPNARTLLMSQGDVLQISITDPRKGLTATIYDLTTGQTGWMTASAKNGFMNTNLDTCHGTPFTFHAEYSTASAGHGSPWTAQEGNVLMTQEIGHSEVCSSLAKRDPVSLSFTPGVTFADHDVYDTCVGGAEAPKATGEGRCAPIRRTIACRNARKQGPRGPVGCRTATADTGVRCEFADGYCLPQGSRTIQINGASATAWSDANQCFADRYQNGDLDFDGLPYTRSAWPNGGPGHPTAFQYVGPLQANGKPYPQIQFETDVDGSAALCKLSSGAGCTVPPIGAEFYPYWSLGSQASALGSRLTSCVWNFGGNLPGTVENFGGDSEYGSPALGYYAGTIISTVMTNPEFAGHCSGATYR